MAAIPNGSRNNGPLNVLNRVSDTKAVCESNIPPATVVYVANDERATKKGAQFQAKNWEPSKYWNIRSCLTSPSLIFPEILIVGSRYLWKCIVNVHTNK